MASSTQILVQAASSVVTSEAMEDEDSNYSETSEDDEYVPGVKLYEGPDLTNYRMEAVRCDLGQYETCPPAMFVKQQRRELEKDVMKREAVTLHEEYPTRVRCSLCLTNLATRVAVPCGHWIGCIDCVVAFIETRNFYQIMTDVNDKGVPLPIKCPQCNALVGKLIWPHKSARCQSSNVL
ncbi:uncharacterized protein LOC111063943 isoform X2 [Nilaparvata lugens]|uniref:uncharacterized protein LOC111063943 isoform X2 n=1 Tax=Nilaparvata lugens TaxID=108931 RepID=UPI00193DEACE|nr:uncharacterized protein LOC111063943 isoform X2 [Nilaparvata lugens]